MRQLDYGPAWNARSSLEDFGANLIARWASDYSTSGDSNPEDLVVVDPGNGFQYLFDLAGSFREQQCSQAPRVVGVWGLSQPGGEDRDRSRMRGFPRPRREQDDRGHLVACAAGGGYDINLVPMDASLNRGLSPEGKRFRAIERRAAALPGTLFFIRPLYIDDSDRPQEFEVGVQGDKDLLVDTFANSGSMSPTPAVALRQSCPFGFDSDVVAGCLDLAAPRDRLFQRGWQSGPASLTRAERCEVAGVTGHVAESVTELLLDLLGWRVLWHFVGPGRHGVDLAFLGPGDEVVAIEVKGTLVRGRVPRLSRNDVAQMSAGWIDKADNPGMAELELGSADVYGGVVAVNFADLTWRMALTADCVVFSPVKEEEQVADLGWFTLS